MKILETERMYLRPYEQSDLDRLSEMYADEDVMRYIGRGGPVTREQTQKGIDAWTKKLYDEYGFGLWAIVDKNSGLLIGHCGFNKLPGDNGIEIAYLLAKDFWGKGLATEISKETLNYGFEKLKLDKIVALAYEANQPSINVLMKLGMNPAGERVIHETKFLYFELTNPAKLHRI